MSGLLPQVPLSPKILPWSFKFQILSTFSVRPPKARNPQFWVSSQAMMLKKGKYAKGKSDGAYLAYFIVLPITWGS